MSFGLVTSHIHVDGGNAFVVRPCDPLKPLKTDANKHMPYEDWRRRHIVAQKKIMILSLLSFCPISTWLGW